MNPKINLVVGWPLSWLLVLLPVFLWLLKNPLGPNFSGSVAIFGSVANLTALTGMTMLALSLILAERSRLLDYLFGGLDKMYGAHELFGKAGFYTILLHPLFLSLRATARHKSFWLLWQFGGSPALTLGQIGLYAFILIIAVTVYLHIRHQTFIKIHRLLGLAFLLGGLHAFLIHGRMSYNPVLKYYLLILSGVAIYTYIYHSLLGRLLIKRYKYEVTAVHNLGSLTTEIVLKPLGKIMNFMPGQAAFLSIKNKVVGKESHPFSMSSSSRDKELKFVIKALGDYTNQAYMIDIGDKATVEGPYGRFSYLNSKNNKQIWLAGGIGVTPFLSMARTLKGKSGYEIDFYYAAKSEPEVFYLGELDAIARATPSLKIVPYPENTQGLISTKVLEKYSGLLKDKDIFICGPPEMMQNLRVQLNQSGVPHRQIHFEEFRF